jgi:hypothetical protein
LQDEGHVSQLITQADDHKTADAWVSLPCTDFTPWQHMNVHRHGWSFQQKLEKRRKQARKMFAQAKRFMKKILAEGGRVAIEWPANSGWWNLEEVKEFEKEYAFRRVYFEGCMLGVHGKDCPIGKPWCVSSCDERILTILAAYQCDHSRQHERAEGSQTKQTATLTLWFGCLTTISCADCIQAYLQCLLEGNTWVILPFELWLEEWKKIYDPSSCLAVKLIKSLYGHPQSGKLWQAHLEKQLIEMKGVPLD